MEYVCKYTNAFYCSEIFQAHLWDIALETVAMQINKK